METPLLPISSIRDLLWRLKAMKISEIMIRDVERVDPALPIAKAAARMRDLNIGFLPICENDKLIGTLTDRDITIKSVAQGRDPWEAPVSEIMRPEVF